MESGPGLLSPAAGDESRRRESRDNGTRCGRHFLLFSQRSLGVISSCLHTIQAVLQRMWPGRPGPLWGASPEKWASYRCPDASLANRVNETKLTHQIQWKAFSAEPPGGNVTVCYKSLPLSFWAPYLFHWLSHVRDINTTLGYRIQTSLVVFTYPLSGSFPCAICISHHSSMVKVGKLG